MAAGVDAADGVSRGSRDLRSRVARVSQEDQAGLGSPAEA
jgi:hypothetical protein